MMYFVRKVSCGLGLWLLMDFLPSVYIVLLAYLLQFSNYLELTPVQFSMLFTEKYDFSLPPSSADIIQI